MDENGDTDIVWSDDPATPVRPQPIMPDPLQLQAIRERWARVATAIGPADRATAEDAVRALYRHAGLAVPTCILWCRSPLAGLRAASIVGQFRQSVRQQVWTKLHANAWQRMSHRFGESGRSSLERDLSDPVGAAIRSLLRSALDAESPEVTTDVRLHIIQLAGLKSATEIDSPARLRKATSVQCAYGQHESSQMAVYDAVASAGLRLEGVTLLSRLAETSGWMWPYDQVCILTERPVRVEQDASGRLHADGRLAVEYPDGWGAYAFEGVHVPAEFFFAPHWMDPAHILGQKNGEVRRLMIERYGIDRLLAPPQAKVVDKDAGRVLYLLRMPGEQPWMMVRVICPSTGHTYCLRVPPDVRTCRAAVAWTFGVGEGEYRPVKET